MIGRELTTEERVHHKDGNPSNNEPSNLQVVTNSEHAQIHYEAERIGLSAMMAETWIPSIEGMVC